MNLSKILFDRVFALIGLLLLAPLLLGCALLIRLLMPGGPVIFRQSRVGRHGRLFTIYKFRTMSVGHGGSSVSVRGESRITPLGSVLRRYKIDELPELWNVLVGDMSFVGPRPDVPGYADRLKGDQRRILSVLPGITGPASLRYRDEESLLAACDDPVRFNDEVIFPDKVRVNLDYMASRSFFTDIDIILRTISGKGWQDETRPHPDRPDAGALQKTSKQVKGDFGRSSGLS